MARGRKDTGNGLFFSQEQGKEQIHFYKLERVPFNIKGTRSGRIHFQKYIYNLLNYIEGKII